MVHYPFRDPYVGSSENLIAPPVVTSSAAGAGWDATLHKDAVTVTGWTNGYNPGVKAPTIGWHAHWKVIEGIPTLVFPRLNSRYTADDSTITANRWLGVSTSNGFDTIITTGTKYCISFEAKADTPGKDVYCGYYYHNGSSRTFHDGYGYARNLSTTEWKRYSFYFTAGTVTSTQSATVYFYGHDSGGDGVGYVRNISLTVVNTVDECGYISKNADSKVYDSSGMGHTIQSVNNAAMSGKDESFEALLGQHENRPANISTKKYSEGCLRTIDALHIPKETTISLYINKNNNGHIIDWRKDSSTGIQPFYISSANLIQYWNSTKSDSNYFNYIFENDIWYHICFVADDTTVKLYVNGVYQESKANAAPVNTACPLTLFARCSNENVVSGKIGDFRIYSTKFSDEDVRKLYQQISIDNKHNVFAKECGIESQGSVVNER